MIHPSKQGLRMRGSWARDMEPVADKTVSQDLAQDP